MPDALILVTLDTTRFDALGYSGAARSRTPVLDRLAAEGVAHFQALTYVPLTLPAHTSMMTGVLPPAHGVHRNGVKVPRDLSLLAEHLRAAGWRTGAVVSARVLASSYGLARGFEFYGDGMDPGYRPSRGLVLVRILVRLGLLAYRYERSAGEATAAALRWLARDDPRPPFLWIHYFDAHAPYQPAGSVACDHAALLAGLAPDEERRYLEGDSPPDWFVEHQRELYRAEVEQIDRALGKLVAGLEELGFWEDGLVLVVADHGESFDHGYYFGHGERIYESTIRVPMILRWPAVLEAGTSRSEIVGVHDVYATLLDAAGLTAPPGGAGRSLVSAPATGPARTHSLHESEEHNGRRLVAIRTPAAKLIVDAGSGGKALFDLERDPRESTDRSRQPAYASRLAQLERMLRERLAGGEARREETPLTDPETREMLRELGYAE